MSNTQSTANEASSTLSISAPALPLIETRHLTKEERVEDLSLIIPRGCVYGFLGPNGSGKSTTLKLLLGLIRPDGGEILYNGVPFTRKNRYDILPMTGSLIEYPAAYPNLTGFENLQIIARLKGASAEEIQEVLETVHLIEQQHRKVRQYSLGMKQRLGIAAALLHQPKILFLDEPTNGLDPAGIQEIRELIRYLCDRHGITILVSSHLLSEIGQMADQVGILHRGHLLYQGALSDLDPTGSHLEEVFLSLTEER